MRPKGLRGGVVSTRLASFNVENMFDRPRAMSRDAAEQSPKVLAAHARVNQLIGRKSYDDATKKRSSTSLRSSGPICRTGPPRTST
jgi:hypothetical protein